MRYIVICSSITMKQITQNKLKGMNWIVSYPDEYRIGLFSTLREAENNCGLCVGTGKHRDGRFGYVEASEGHTVYYSRISSMEDEELDQMIFNSIQDNLSSLGEMIERQMYDDNSMSQAYSHRDDGYLVGEDDSQLYEHCENGKIHRVLGVETIIVYH